MQRRHSNLREAREFICWSSTEGAENRHAKGTTTDREDESVQLYEIQPKSKPVCSDGAYSSTSNSRWWHRVTSQMAAKHESEETGTNSKKNTVKAKQKTTWAAGEKTSAQMAQKEEVRRHGVSCGSTEQPRVVSVATRWKHVPPSKTRQPKWYWLSSPAGAPSRGQRTKKKTNPKKSLSIHFQKVTLQLS